MSALSVGLLPLICQAQWLGASRNPETFTTEKNTWPFRFVCHCSLWMESLLKTVYPIPAPLLPWLSTLLKASKAPQLQALFLRPPHGPHQKETRNVQGIRSLWCHFSWPSSPFSKQASCNWTMVKEKVLCYWDHHQQTARLLTEETSPLLGHMRPPPALSAQTSLHLNLSKESRDQLRKNRKEALGGWRGQYFIARLLSMSVFKPNKVRKCDNLSQWVEWGVSSLSEGPSLHPHVHFL